MGEKEENPDENTINRRLQEINDSLIVSQEVTVTKGTATGGDANTIIDTNKSFEVDMWKKGYFKVIKEDKDYFGIIVDNSETEINIQDLAGEASVEEGDEYNLILPVVNVRVKDTSIQEENETIQSIANEITGEDEGEGAGRSLADVDGSVNETNSTIDKTQEDILNVGFANRSWQVYQPGIVIGSEITIDDDANQLTIVVDDNDKFNLMLDSKYVDSTEDELWTEIQIAADTYVSGETFVQAIRDAIVGAGKEGEVSVIWEGNDTGYIVFVSNLFGSHYMPLIADPDTVTHSALTDMGCDEIQELYGDLTLEEVYKLLEEEGTRITSINKLITEERLVFGEGDTEVISENIDPAGNEVILAVSNSSGESVDVILQHRTDEGIYHDWHDSNGVQVSFTVADTESLSFGPLSGWLKFWGGRVIIDAGASAPGDGSEVDIIVQEVS